MAKFFPYAILASAFFVLMNAQADTDLSQGDWPNYNGQIGGSRYSPLNQINKTNVSQLQQVWSHPAGNQGVPIVVDGIMYVSTPRGVAALEAHSGEEIWTYRHGRARPSGRGVSYWAGDESTAPRILFIASRNQLVALDAASGELSAPFGNQGVVDTGIGYGSTPTIFRNLIIIGAAVGEIPIGDPGNTRAFDARTGQKLWEFETVPGEGQPGHETWLNDGWKGRSGTNVWAFSMTVDEDRGILYMPVAGPSPNYYGGDRPGSNLFANSVVAIDAESGEYLWHFQTVHHDLWDSDQPSPPVLLDIEHNGVTVPALALVGKTSYMFILNRITGEPVFGVEERAVLAGNVPGEWYSPTQPFPIKPPPLSRVSFTKADLVTASDTTSEHANACQAFWDESGGFRNEGPFTPFLFHEAGATPQSSVQFPGGTGGVNWGGPAADPNSGYIFVSVNETSIVGWVERRSEEKGYGRGVDGTTQLYDRGSVDGSGPYRGLQVPMVDKAGNSLGDWFCQKPPWSQLVAVNANTGAIVWKVVLGINENLPEGKQNVGGAGSAGPTVTAAGLVFIGATNDKRFRAFDASTGKELWFAQLDTMAGANPMSYMGKDGKQYVSIASGYKVLTFALP